jgi:hypothetical protein
VYLYADTQHIAVGSDVAVLMSTCGTALVPPEGRYWLRQVTGKAADTTGCPAVAGSVRLDLSTVRGEPDALLPGGTTKCFAYAVLPVTRVRYQVRNDADGMPVLQRVVGTEAAARTDVVAWGIEDMQVTYLPASDLGNDTKFVHTVTPVEPAKYETLTMEVEVRLWSRTQHGNIAGASATTAADAAVRGQLVSRVAPRSVLYAISSDPAATRVWY